MADSDSETSSESNDYDFDVSKGGKARSDNGPRNIYKNDGSFLKMFQQLQREGKPKCEPEASGVHTPPTEPLPPRSSTSPAPSSTTPPSSSHNNTPSSSGEKESAKKKPVMSFVGKRRGGRVLPTGVVKKQRKDDAVKETGCPKNAWSQYMEEVRKYKELSCEEEEKTRPLVK